MMNTGIRHARRALLLTLLVGSATFPSPTGAQSAGGDVAATVQAMQRAASAPLSVVHSPLTGHVSFLSTTSGGPVPIAAWTADPAETRAGAFLDSYGTAFGLPDASHARVDRVAGPDAFGMEHVRYRQLHDGIPVTGGELAIHLKGASVVAVNAKTLPIVEKIDTMPSLEAPEALARARVLVDKHFPNSAAVLSEPQLEIFNRGLLEGRLTATHLAWFIEARGTDLWQYIWLDAHTGKRLLDFSQLPHALSRKVYTANNTAVLPGTLIRAEGDAATGDADADHAYDFAGDTYNYYLTQHGRDSFDGFGSPIISTTHYCPSAAACPYPNAFWNGSQMVYGTGFASADDVVAHELTHAVTQFSANLFSFVQSGALGESYSDIFGETVDLLNGHGNDSPAARWLIGEDLPIGAIRNMMNPNSFGDPGKMSDAQFRCPGPSDKGGIHHNNGVPNHAYALMADGGSYNAFAITGIGLIKAGKIQYRALTMYLLRASDFLDNYNALKQACTDLIGTASITPADCAEVGKALDAVEMANLPRCDVSLPYCPAGMTPNDFFFDDLENPASGNWAISTITGVKHWFYPPPPLLVLPASGEQNFWGYDAPAIGDSVIGMTRSVAIPSGARLQFNHLYSFEHDDLNFDGGVIEYSTNNGANWTDAGSLITAGATYGGTLSSSFGNPLAGRPAFVKESIDYKATQLNLASLAGQSVRFRFRIGTDDSLDDLGWFIDDIRIYTCVAAPARLVNISTRGRVDIGDNVMIGGFIIEGSSLRRVLVRALGPSLANFGVPGVLPNPLLQVFTGPTAIARNDDWQLTDPLCQASGYACGTPSEIAATALAPSNSLESAILVTLPPGAYTAIVSGAGGSTGVGLIEVYDVDSSPSVTSDLINISTRARVETGANAMIGGFVIGGNAPKKVVVRAIGPSLSNFGVPGVLANPFLQVFSGSTAIAQNNDWQASDPLCQMSGHTCGSPSDIEAEGLAPSNPLEAAVMITLSPGPYTAIVSGVGNGTGVGLVEVFEVP